MPEENAKREAAPAIQTAEAAERGRIKTYEQFLKEATERALSRMQGKDQGLER